MQDMVTSIKAFLYERAVSPLLGAFLLGWSVWNYRFFVILLFADFQSVIEKFSAIDMLFAPYDFVIGEQGFELSGKLIDGIFVPAIIALAYLYVYPLLAKPIYEHSLKKQKELRAIKQAQEDQRLLSVEESRELYRRMAQMKARHDEEVDHLNNEISALNHKLENASPKEPDLPPWEQARLESEVDQKLENQLGEYNLHIRDALEEIPRHKGFYLNDLFGQNRWSDIPLKIRLALEKRFRGEVERGDFVGVQCHGVKDDKRQMYIRHR